MDTKIVGHDLKLETINGSIERSEVALIALTETVISLKTTISVIGTVCGMFLVPLVGAAIYHLFK